MIVNSPRDSDLIVQKISCDLGIHRIGRKGTYTGPKRLMEDFVFEKNVLLDDVFVDEFSLENTHRKVEDNVEDLVRYNKPILSIGGDHSVSFPVLKVLKKKYPDMKLVWIDSHLDIKRKVDNHVSHDVVIRELIENHNFKPEEIYFVGITKIDQDEEDFLNEEKGFNVYMHDEVSDFLTEASFEEKVYASVDIDVLDKSLAPGTGYPDGKLDLESVRNILDFCNPDFSDLVEVAPSLDEEMKTVTNGRKILKMLERNLAS